MRCFAALLFFSPLLAVPAGAQDQKPVVEEETGIAFARTLEAAGGGTHTLVGTGVREKTVFNVNVYAIGYYVDVKAAVAALGKYQELKAERIEKNKEFAQSILTADYGKTIRLVLARDVDAEDMREAFEDQLQPRLKAKSKPEDLEQTQKLMAAFRGYFGENMKEGDSVVFTWQPGGKLHTTVNGVEKAALESHTLCWALFDVYLGPDAISTSARNNFLRGLHGELQRARQAEGGRQP